MARSTRGLERLSISWSLDALSFFQEYFRTPWDHASPGCPSRQTWPNLLKLTLTCSELAEGTKHNGNIVIAAARAVKLMPRLRLLEIWNCGNESASLFRFAMRDKEDKPPLINWGTSWPLQFTLEFESWIALAKERDSRGREPEIALYRLKLGERIRAQSVWGLCSSLSQDILHPTSRYQVWLEELVANREGGTDLSD